jgi:alpha-glucosidase
MIAGPDFGGRAELEAQIARLVAEGRLAEGDVRLAGRISDEELAKAKAAADIVVAGSPYEGFGLTLVEAGVAGAPVAGTPTFASMEHMVTGLMVPPMDPAAMAVTVIAGLRNPKVLARLAATARARALSDEFDWRQIAQRTVDEVFREALAAGARHVEVGNPPSIAGIGNVFDIARVYLAVGDRDHAGWTLSHAAGSTEPAIIGRRQDGIDRQGRAYWNIPLVDGVTEVHYRIHHGAETLVVRGRTDLVLQVETGKGIPGHEVWHDTAADDTTTTTEPVEPLPTEASAAGARRPALSDRDVALLGMAKGELLKVVPVVLPPNATSVDAVNFAVQTGVRAASGLGPDTMLLEDIEARAAREGHASLMFPVGERGLVDRFVQNFYSTSPIPINLRGSLADLSLSLPDLELRGRRAVLTSRQQVEELFADETNHDASIVIQTTAYDAATDAFYTDRWLARRGDDGRIYYLDPHPSIQAASPYWLYTAGFAPGEGCVVDVELSALGPDPDVAGAVRPIPLPGLTLANSQRPGAGAPASPQRADKSLLPPGYAEAVRARRAAAAPGADLAPENLAGPLPGIVDQPAVVLRLANVVRPYAWGSLTAIAELQGREPSGGPEAELWLGAHPGAPSQLPDGSTLDNRIAADPVGELGAEVVAEFGPMLPFLGKILAAAGPLSLQVHPTIEQAQVGFAAENAAGIPVDGPTRNYRDANHKPELICALTPFTALVGFRPVEATAQLMAGLGVPELAPYERMLVTEGLGSVVGALLRDGTPALVEAVVAACAVNSAEFAAERALAVRLTEKYPGDPGIVVALLLNLVQLAPGEALFLPAGNMHAYVEGVGVEVMANSDNVLRGGLTPKHVDVPELLKILDPEPAAASILTPLQQPNGEWVYDTPAQEFRLSRIDSGTTVVDGAGPQILIVLDGGVRLRQGDVAVELARGESAYLPAGRGPLTISGDGTTYRITTNRPTDPVMPSEFSIPQDPTPTSTTTADHPAAEEHPPAARRSLNEILNRVAEAQESAIGSATPLDLTPEISDTTSQLAAKPTALIMPATGQAALAQPSQEGGLRLLVTGGAGYIGSVVTFYLLQAGHHVTVVDDLSTGHADAIPDGADFVQSNIVDLDLTTMGRFDGVLHFAAKSLVGESVEFPELYWQGNFAATRTLLRKMRAAGIPRLVFSSTAATYGEPEQVPILEAAPTQPTNPYGETKLAIDHMIARAAAEYRLAAVSLRYFNVAGAVADETGRWYGERHRTETHLIPIALQVATGDRESLTIYGEDYPTPDGTCLRDYIHVADLAEAHLLALGATTTSGVHRIYNLGNGTGFSVRQVIEAVEAVTSLPMPVNIGPRRAGDPAILVASSATIRDELGWVPQRPTLEEMVADAWAFVQRARATTADPEAAAQQPAPNDLTQTADTASAELAAPTPQGSAPTGDLGGQAVAPGEPAADGSARTDDQPPAARKQGEREKYLATDTDDPIAAQQQLAAQEIAALTDLLDPDADRRVDRVTVSARIALVEQCVAGAQEIARLAAMAAEPVERFTRLGNPTAPRPEVFDALVEALARQHDLVSRYNSMNKASPIEGFTSVMGDSDPLYSGSTRSNPATGLFHVLEPARVVALLSDAANSSIDPELSGRILTAVPLTAEGTQAVGQGARLSAHVADNSTLAIFDPPSDSSLHGRMYAITGKSPISLALMLRHEDTHRGQLIDAHGTIPDREWVEQQAASLDVYRDLTPKERDEASCRRSEWVELLRVVAAARRRGIDVTNLIVEPDRWLLADDVVQQIAARAREHDHDHASDPPTAAHVLTAGVVDELRRLEDVRDQLRRLVAPLADLGWSSQSEALSLLAGSPMLDTSALATIAGEMLENDADRRSAIEMVPREGWPENNVFSIAGFLVGLADELRMPLLRSYLRQTALLDSFDSDVAVDESDPLAEARVGLAGIVRRLVQCDLDLPAFLLLDLAGAGRLQESTIRDLAAQLRFRTDAGGPAATIGRDLEGFADRIADYRRAVRDRIAPESTDGAFATAGFAVRGTDEERWTILGIGDTAQSAYPDGFRIELAAAVRYADGRVAFSEPTMHTVRPQADVEPVADDGQVRLFRADEDYDGWGVLAVSDRGHSIVDLRDDGNGGRLASIPWTEAEVRYVIVHPDGRVDGHGFLDPAHDSRHWRKTGDSRSYTSMAAMQGGMRIHWRGERDHWTHIDGPGVHTSDRTAWPENHEDWGKLKERYAFTGPDDDGGYSIFVRTPSVDEEVVLVVHRYGDKHVDADQRFVPAQLPSGEVWIAPGHQAIFETEAAAQAAIWDAARWTEPVLAASTGAVRDSGRWWSNGLFYQVYIRSFADGNGDGVGDLAGLLGRLDHLSRLGVEAIWVTPFYTSPMVDNGYDVVDPRDIDPLFGDLAIFDDLVTELHHRGMKLVIDLVPNHTSDQHPWFVEALASEPGSLARQRYHFRDGRGVDGAEPPNNWGSLFETGLAWTRVADGQWYCHLFAPEQPDLNWDNEEVAEDFERTMRFWLDRGVDGFRIDVAHGIAKHPEYLDVPAGTHVMHPGDHRVDNDGVHRIHRMFRRVTDDYPDRMLVGEATLENENRLDDRRLAAYARADELNQMFNFWLLNADWSARDLTDAIGRSIGTMGTVGAAASWVLSSHDRSRQVSRYGGGAVGVRRARAAALVQLALPGATYIYNGDELGLSDVDLPDEALQDPIWERSGHRLRGRDSVRVPLPWEQREQSFGFTSGDESPWLPMPESFAPLAVDAQVQDSGSTLSLYRQALQLRKTHPAFTGDQIDWYGAPTGCLALIRHAGNGGPGNLVVALNASPDPVPMPAGQVLLASWPLSTPAELPGNTAVWLLPDKPSARREYKSGDRRLFEAVERGGFAQSAADATALANRELDGLQELAFTRSPGPELTAVMDRMAMVRRSLAAELGLPDSAMGQQVIRTLTARGLARRMDEGMYELGQEALRLALVRVGPAHVEREPARRADTANKEPTKAADPWIRGPDRLQPTGGPSPGDTAAVSRRGRSDDSRPGWAR